MFVILAYRHDALFEHGVYGKTDYIVVTIIDRRKTWIEYKSEGKRKNLLLEYLRFAEGRG